MLAIKSFPGQKVNFEHRTINAALSPHGALPSDDQHLCSIIKSLSGGARVKVGVQSYPYLTDYSDI